MRIGSALWVRPPKGPAVKLCGLSRAIRIDAGGPTVVGVIAGRWVLYQGRWEAVATEAAAAAGRA